VAVSQFATPAELEDCKQRIENLTVEQNVLDKEAAIGVVNQKRMDDIVECLTFEQNKEQALTEKWQQEKEVVDAVLSARKTLRDLLTEQKASALQVSEAALNADGTPVTLIDNAAAITAAKAELDEQHAKLSELQGENPLILPACDEQAVASVVADWTGVPVGKMVNDEINTVLNLANIMKQRVIGQDHGMEMIAKRIQTSRAGLDNPNKPIGVFMLCGPSGTGKTETALALAEALYGGEQNVITINMSEFQEAHTVSTLKGAPPGYVGYGEGGILTEAVRRTKEDTHFKKVVKQL
jgi:type VI secretion system protein VasG